jgi:hypothetical protein
MEFKEYRDEINHIFTRYGRRGFVDYYACRGLYSDMASLLVRATSELGRSGQYKELFDLANKAFLKWGKVDKDDSDGETADFVCYVMDAWDAVYAADDKTMNHSKMLDWFIKNLDGSVVDYMEDYLCEYVMERFKEDRLLTRKLECFKDKIDKCLASDNPSRYEYSIDRYREYVLTIMGELHYPIEEIRAYASGIGHCHGKAALAKIELAYGNTDIAISAYEQLADEEDDRWGRNEYREILMNIYKENGDHERYIENLRKALLHSVGDTDLWAEYKTNFSDNEWPNAREEIFVAMKVGDDRAYPWYETEGRYDLIMSGIEASGATDQLKEYEKKLKKLYPERCLAVLVARADDAATYGNKRSDYRRLAGLLRWIQRYPNGDDISEKLAQKYRDEYPRRSAMIEELARF